MAKLERKKKVPTDPVARSIYYRESGIRRMRENIQRIREDAELKVAEIERGIREKSVLLDALKRGKLNG